MHMLVTYIIGSLALIVTSSSRNLGETPLVSCHFSLHILIFFHLPDSALPVRHEVMQLPLP